jgi:hypothetical protein
VAGRVTHVTGSDIVTLFVLALPVAAIAWTVTHEELFGELHDRFVTCSRSSRSLAARKFFYLLTCEYCFSHYVAAGVLLATRFTLLYADWRGYAIAWLSLVWVANHYISVYGWLRLDLRSERLDVGLKEAVARRQGVGKIDDGAREARDRKAG